MKIDLPDRLELNCAHCMGEFAVQTGSLGGKYSLKCPLCGESVDILPSLAPNLQRRVYFAIKYAIENTALDSGNDEV